MTSTGVVLVIVTLGILVTLQLATNWVMWSNIQSQSNLASGQQQDRALGQGGAADSSLGGLDGLVVPRGSSSQQHGVAPGRGSWGAPSANAASASASFVSLSSSSSSSSSFPSSLPSLLRGHASASAPPRRPAGSPPSSPNSFLGRYFNGPPPAGGAPVGAGGLPPTGTSHRPPPPPTPAAQQRLERLDLGGDAGGGDDDAAARPAFPPAGVTGDEFHAVWEGSWDMGTSLPVRFVVVAEGGVRLTVNGRVLLDAWRHRRSDGGGPERHVIPSVALGPGDFQHVRLEYYRAPSRSIRRHMKLFVGGDPLAEGQEPSDLAKADKTTGAPDESEWFRMAKVLADARVRLSWEPDPMGLKVYVEEKKSVLFSVVQGSLVRCSTGGCVCLRGVVAWCDVVCCVWCGYGQLRRLAVPW